MYPCILLSDREVDFIWRTSLSPQDPRHGRCHSLVVLLLLLLQDSELDALTLGEGNQRLVSLSDHKDVLDSRGEGVSSGILQVDNVVGTLVLLPVEDNSDSAGVMASGDHGDIAVVEPDEVLHLDKGVWVPQGPSVVGCQGWDGLLAKLDVLDP